ncbi:DKNYY domain-containing protein, partial [uncultured Duncaniella sp.]
MRKLHLILILSLSFVAGADLTAQNRGHRHDKMEYCHDERMRHADKEKNHRRHHRQTYFVDSKGVYFNGRPVKDASPSSFKVLDGYYAKDTWNVYWRGEKIQGATSNSFRVIGDGYAKDAWNVYFFGHKVPGASPNGFKTLKDGYAKDSWLVYFKGKKV